MKAKRSSNILIIIFLASVVSFAQDVFTARVDEFIKTEMERQKIPGVSLAVVKDGKPLIVKGYGFANLEHQVPVKPETIFQSGSVGKQFTATAVMLLVEEGKIGLDEKIGKYLGEVPDGLEEHNCPPAALAHRRNDRLSAGFRLSPRLHRG